MAKVKQRINKGVTGGFILSILFVIFGIFMLSVNLLETYEQLSKDGQVYTGIHDTKNDNTDLAVSIQSVSDLIEEAKTGDYYLAWTSDGYLVVVEVPRGDKTLQQLEKDEEDMLIEPYHFTARQVPFDAASQTKLKQYFSNTEVKDVVNTQSLLSIPEYSNNKLYMTIFAIVILAIGVGVMIVAIIQRGKNKKGYETLYAAYPELKNDFSLVEKNSKYYDTKLAISVYNNHILFMKQRFACVELDHIEWLGYNINTVYVRGIKTQTYSIVAHLGTVNSNTNEKNITPFAVGQGKYKVKMEPDIQAFFAFIGNHYPHIKLGEDNKPEKTKENKKMTIDEFLEHNKVKNTQEDSDE
ncbi:MULTISPECIES: hypothetical protein [unclassified Granulicatella]|uniref:hypothetical protein n=1 Tax=unclassified Granulicatella TaxID=2630493 RepID=UPI0010731F5E|nr:MULTISPECIES: hypothetical protein [unclassified Granulicatella]MBF0780945.1 hypothetical protein [Granulicatella sp. 19428wC4_WM01]TFU92987.1 hypothetical protein E4T68_07500 [Granulicatella sp. WM01]